MITTIIEVVTMVMVDIITTKEVEKEDLDASHASKKIT
jgi:hypothetical protein